MTTDTLAGLIEKVRVATGPDRELNEDILKHLGFHSWAGRMSYHDAPMWIDFGSSEITASIDAALALCERCGFPLGPGKWNYTMAAAYGSFSIIPNDPHSTGIHDKRCGHAHGAPTIPLAIILATLLALQSKGAA